MMKKILYLVSLSLLLASCVQQKEEIKEPSVLKMVPEASVGESWRAHDLKIMVVCDLEAKVELMCRFQSARYGIREPGGVLFAWRPLHDAL